MCPLLQLTTCKNREDTIAALESGDLLLGFPSGTGNPGDEADRHEHPDFEADRHDNPGDEADRHEAAASMTSPKAIPQPVEVSVEEMKQPDKQSPPVIPYRLPSSVQQDGDKQQPESPKPLVVLPGTGRRLIPARVDTGVRERQEAAQQGASAVSPATDRQPEAAPVKEMRPAAITVQQGGSAANCPKFVFGGVDASDALGVMGLASPRRHVCDCGKRFKSEQLLQDHRVRVTSICTLIIINCN